MGRSQGKERGSVQEKKGGDNLARKLSIGYVGGCAVFIRSRKKVLTLKSFKKFRASKR